MFLVWVFSWEDPSPCFFVCPICGSTSHVAAIPSKKPSSSLHLRRNAADQFRNHQIHLEQNRQIHWFFCAAWEPFWMMRYDFIRPPHPPKKTGKLFKETNARCFHVFFLGWGGVALLFDSVFFLGGEE